MKYYLNFTGTYNDLLIIEPAIPIMVDTVTEKKKKKKKSSSLKRSKSNVSIRDSSLEESPQRIIDTSERKMKQIEKLETSSAGVLFYNNQDTNLINSNGYSQNPEEICNNSLDHDVVDGSMAAEVPVMRSYVEDVSLRHVDDVNPKVKRNSYPLDFYPRVCYKPKLMSSVSVDGANSSCFCEGVDKSYSRHSKKIKHRHVSLDSSINREVYSEQYYRRLSCDHNYYEPDISPVLTIKHNHPHYYNSYVPSHNIYGVNGFDYTYEPVIRTNGYHHVDRADFCMSDVNSVNSRCPPVPMHHETSPPRSCLKGNKTKLRSDNWEWYAAQPQRQNGGAGSSSSETVSSCSDSSHKSKIEVVEMKENSFKHTTEKRRKKKSKTHRTQVLVEENLAEVEGGT